MARGSLLLVCCPPPVQYEGSWVQGKRTGLGKEKLANGEVYEGEFKVWMFLEVHL